MSFDKQKKSQRAIASTRHISTKSVAAVLRRADELGINLTDAADKTPDEIYTLFFPEKFQKETVYAPVDYGYVHNELKKYVPLILYQEIMVRLKERRQCGSNPVRLRFSERDTHLICSISHTQLSANNKHSSALSLKTVHRTVFFTLAFKSLVLCFGVKKITHRQKPVSYFGGGQGCLLFCGAPFRLSGSVRTINIHLLSP